jgi:hypothetical protein
MSFRKQREELDGLGSPADRRDKFQPVIPWRVGLHQCPLPLRRPLSECCTVVLPVESSNGEQCLIRLSQPRGLPHFPRQSRHRSFRVFCDSCADRRIVRLSCWQTNGGLAHSRSYKIGKVLPASS